jgi:hypothetical protein
MAMGTAESWSASEPLTKHRHSSGNPNRTIAPEPLSPDLGFIKALANFIQQSRSWHLFYQI